MYVGAHYNSYYNSIYGSNVKSAYSAYATAKTSNSQLYPFGETQATKNFSNLDSLYYAQGVKSGAADLRTSLGMLGSSAFTAKAAVASDADSVSLQSSAWNNKAKTTLRIDQLASGQVNEGGALKSSALAGAGQNQFSIETGGKSYGFAVSVSATDTNQSMQQKMADAINKQGIGVKASVVTDSKAGTSMLRLSSAYTGDDAKSRFNVKDVSGSIVAKTGAANVNQQAQDARYAVNGGEVKTSKSNTVDLGNGLTATFKKAAGRDIEITAGADKNGITQRVEEMASSYNKLVGALRDRLGDAKANSAYSQLSQAGSTYASSLSKAGITFDKSGMMKLDSEKLGKAIDDGSLQKLFSNQSYGFSAQLNRAASNASLSSMGMPSTAFSLFGSTASNDFYSMTQQNMINSLMSGSFFSFGV